MGLDKNDTNDKNGKEQTGVSTTDSYRAGYTTAEASKIAGVTKRQLDEWARNHSPVEPSLKEAAGSGSRRLYSYNDLLDLRTVKQMLDAGMALTKIKKIFKYVKKALKKELKDRALASHIVISGDEVFVAVDGQLEDVLRRPGQGVLNVVPFGPIQQEVAQQIKTVRPELTADGKPDEDDGQEQLKLIAD